MKIAIGKLGRSCYFDKKHWSIYAGDDTPLIFYRTLCEKYPEHEFYMVGPSDFQRWDKSNEFPKNFIDIYGECKKDMKDELEEAKKTQTAWKVLVKYINDKDIKFDFGVILIGPDTPVSLMGVGQHCLTAPDREAKALEMAANYVAPIIGVLNDQMFPWVGINEDPRYIPYNNRDIVNDEQVILTQINTQRTVTRISGYFDKALIYRRHDIKYKYAGTERIFLNDLKRYDFRDPDHIDVDGEIYQKTNDFIITVNGGGNRLEFMEKWIFNDKPDQVIYGKWSDKEKENHPDNFIQRGICEMNPLMWQTKFTFIPAFEKRLKNFVTQKLWKMIYFGIIPFFDKNGYDTDMLEPVPSICRVETPAEMWKRIDALNKDKESYKKLLNYFYNLLEDKYFNGEFIKDMIDPYIAEVASK